MRKGPFIILLILFGVGFAYGQSPEFRLKAIFPDTLFREDSVFLQKLDVDDLSRVETIGRAKIENGTFSFVERLVDGNEPYLISIPSDGDDVGFYTVFIAEPGEISIGLMDSTVVIKGGEANRLHESFKTAQLELYKEMTVLQQSMQDLYFSGDMSQSMALNMQKDLVRMQGDMSDLVYSYVKDNIGNRIGEFYLLVYVNNFTPEQLKELYAQTNTTFRDTKIIKSRMERLVWNPESIQEGKTFKDLTLYTSDRKEVRISDYAGKGKVILLDFWASWCGPCRKEMPELVALYTKFKSRDFEILGISLDERESAWENAIQSMNMEWVQLSDLNGWGSIAAKEYGISFIPQNFLLDRAGRIVGHNLHGEELKNKIDKLLSEENKVEL